MPTLSAMILQSSQPPASLPAGYSHLRRFFPTARERFIALGLEERPRTEADETQLLAEVSAESVDTLVWLCRRLERRLGRPADVRDFLLLPQLEFDARPAVALLYEHGREGAQMVVDLVDAARRGEDLPTIDGTAGTWDRLRSQFSAAPARRTRRRSGNRRRTR